MRTLRLAAAVIAAFFAWPAGAALPQLALACSPVSAGQDEPCTISRVSGGQGIFVLFVTSDGTAKSGADYTSVRRQVYLKGAQQSAIVTVHTLANPNASGNLTFSAAVAGGASVVRAAGSIVEPVPMPMPPPPSSGFVPAAGFHTIADNFNTTDGLATNSWVTGPSPDDLGNFRMICGAGQILPDDPIVYPGQAGKSHPHQFFGNLGADANSSYQSLRTTGRSTCGDPTSDAPVNRSGYWMPAMKDGAGNYVKPEYVAIYYKRAPSSSPECTAGDPAFIGICVGIPAGLRFITGYNMLAGNMGDAHPFFYCQDSDLGGAKAVNSSLQNDMPSVIPLCPISARLTLNIAGPDCWDGINLDTPDHRSHVAHGGYVWDPTTNTSHYRCDPGHKYHIPQMSIMAFYPVDANFEAGKWHLSSDEMVPGAVPGSTFHTDYWEAWSPSVRQTWNDYCTNMHLQCAGGDLGNGTRIKGMTVPNTSGLVPVPMP